MTWRDLRDGIEEDSNAADYGVENWDGFEAALDALFSTLADFMHSPVDMFDHDDLARSEEEHGEMCEQLYAYFGIEEEHT